MSEARLSLPSGATFATLSELIASPEFSSGSVVTFLTDVTLDQVITITKNCAFNLDGHFLFVPMPHAITVKGGARVSFYSGKIQTVAAGPVEDVLIVQGSNTVVTIGAELEIDTFGTAVYVRKRGCLSVDGGAVRARGDQPTVFVEDDKSTVILAAGSIAAYDRSAIVARSSSTVTITGGEIYTECDGKLPEDTYPAVLVSDKSTSMQVNGGTVFAKRSIAVKVTDGSTVEMSGGMVYSNSGDYPAVELLGVDSVFSLADGDVYSNKTSAFLSAGLSYDTAHQLVVKGGKVGAVGRIVNVAGPGEHKVLFSAGKVKGKLSANQLATGYVVSDIKDDDGYAAIILKTWTDESDASPVFPEKYPPVPLVPDPRDRQPLPFPPVDIAGTPDDQLTGPTVVVPASPSVPIPYPPIPQPQPVPKIVFNSSVNVKRTISIYKTPSRKMKITEWRGALRIYDGGYFGPNNDEEFAMVKFRTPGSGQIVTGYVPVYELSRP